MLLRLRLLLIVLGAALLSAVLVGVPAWVALDAADGAQDEANRTSQNLLWRNSLDTAGAPFRSFAEALATRPELAQHLAEGNFRALAGLLSAYAAQASGTLAVERIDVVSGNGRLVASSAGLGVEEPLVDAVGVSRQLPTAGVLTGVEMDGSQHLLLTVSRKLPDGFFVSVSGPFAPAATGFAQLLGTDVFVLTARARMLTAAQPAAWPGPAEGALLDDDVVLRTVSDGRWLALVPSTVANSANSPVAVLYTARDMTRVVHARLLLACSVAALVLLFLSVAAIGLNSYLRGALLPLKDVRNVLRALQRGDTFLLPAPRRHDDEVGEVLASAEALRHATDAHQRSALVGQLRSTQAHRGSGGTAVQGSP